MRWTVGVWSLCGLRRKSNRCVGFNAVWVLQRRPSSHGVIINTLQNIMAVCIFGQLSHLVSCFSFCVVFCLCLISSQIYSLCSFVKASFYGATKEMNADENWRGKTFWYSTSCTVFLPLSTHTHRNKGLIVSRIKKTSSLSLSSISLI